MAKEQTFAQRMVEALQQVLIKNPAVTSISVDGQSTSFASMAEVQTALLFWEGRAAREKGKRPFFKRIDQSTGWNG